MNHKNKSEQEIVKQRVEERLNEMHTRYRAVSSDNIDPELEAQIRELKWVLRVMQEESKEKYISHDG